MQTLCYVLNGAKSYPLQAWPRPLQFLHRLLYSTITSFRECSPSTPFFHRTLRTSADSQRSW